MSDAGAPRFEMRGIRKAFPGVVALDGVSFACRAGEIHALCGENGAGKSTLMKVLGGVYAPDAGEILVDGAAARFAHPAAARAAGISIIHQELSLLPDRTRGARTSISASSRCAASGWTARRCGPAPGRCWRACPPTSIRTCRRAT